MEFSKKIVVAILSVYIVSFVFTNLADVLWGKNLSYILEYAYKGLLLIIPYSLKAGVENFAKINKSNKFSDEK